MPYELSHDTIARQVFEKASTEARTRRKVERYVRERYQAWQEREAKLTQDDVDFINPYLSQINISQAEVIFVENGKKELRRARRLRRFLAVLAVATLTTFSIVSFGLWRNAEQQKQVADQRTQEALRSDSLAQMRAVQAMRSDSLAQLRAKEAIVAQRADSLKAIELGLALTDANLQRLAAERETRAAKALSLGGVARTLPLNQLPLAIRLAEAGYYHTAPIPPALPVIQNLASTFYEQFGMVGDPNYYLPTATIVPATDKIIDIALLRTEGPLLALTENGAIQRWTLAGKLIDQMTLPEPAIQLVQDTAGLLIATKSDNGPIHLRDLKGISQVALALPPAKLPTDEEPNWQVDISPNGAWILTHHEGDYRLWSRQGQLQTNLLPTYEGAKRQYAGFYFSPDSRYLLATNHGRSEVRFSELVDLQEYRHLRIAAGFSSVFGSINQCLFVEEEGYLILNISGFERPGVQAFRLTDGELLGYLAVHSDDFNGEIMESHTIYRLYYDENKQLVTQTFREEAYWDTSPRVHTIEAKRENFRSFKPLLSLDFDPTATSSYVRQSAGIYRYGQDRSLLNVFLFPQAVSGLHYKARNSDDHKVITALDRYGRITIWNTNIGIVRSFAAHATRIVSVAYSKKGDTVLSIAEDGQACLHTIDGKLLASFNHFPVGITRGDVRGIHFSPDEQEVATVDKKMIKIWDRSGKLQQTYNIEYEGNGTYPESNFFPNGEQVPMYKEYLSGAGLGTRWNIDHLTDFGPYDAWGFNYVKRSPDYKYGFHAFLDSRKDRYEEQSVVQYEGDFELIQWPSTPLFREIFFAPDNSAILFLFEEGPPQCYALDGTPGPVFSGNNSRINSAAFSPNSQYIITASEDGVVKLWQRNGELLGEFNRNGVSANSVSFSPDGQYVLMGLANGEIRIVPMPDRILRYLQNETLIPPLTPQQRQAYGL